MCIHRYKVWGSIEDGGRLCYQITSLSIHSMCIFVWNGAGAKRWHGTGKSNSPQEDIHSDTDFEEGTPMGIPHLTVASLSSFGGKTCYLFLPCLLYTSDAADDVSWV